MRRARLRAGYRTQGELAERMAVTQQAVSDWETDKEKPRAEHIATLVELVGIDPYLFAGTARHDDELLEVLNRMADAVEACARALRGR